MERLFSEEFGSEETLHVANTILIADTYFLSGFRFAFKAQSSVYF